MLRRVTVMKTNLGLKKSDISPNKIHSRSFTLMNARGQSSTVMVKTRFTGNLFSQCLLSLKGKQ